MGEENWEPEFLPGKSRVWVFSSTWLFPSFLCWTIKSVYDINSKVQGVKNSGFCSEGIFVESMDARFSVIPASLESSDM